jgi:hypothetical protein
VGAEKAVAHSADTIHIEESILNVLLCVGIKEYVATIDVRKEKTRRDQRQDARYIDEWRRLGTRLEMIDKRTDDERAYLWV